jgi:hypothetical protein
VHWPQIPNLRRMPGISGAVAPRFGRNGYGSGPAGSTRSDLWQLFLSFFGKLCCAVGNPSYHGFPVAQFAPAGNYVCWVSTGRYIFSWSFGGESNAIDGDN